MKVSLPILILFIYSLISCSWETEYKSAAKRSLQQDTDIVLVPYPFNIFDKESRDAITLSHYSQEEIKNILKEHDLSWDELKQSWNWKEDEKSFQKEVNYTSHYTQYSYDTSIPIWLIGNKWFRNGIYPDRIHQQHIPSLLARILDFSFANQIDIRKFDKIFRTTEEKPKLIVTIVIDQGGLQLYNAHPQSFPFLKSLKEKSAYFKNAKVGHLEAHTAVGHAAIGTGAYPAETHAFSNEIYTWKEGKLISRPIYQGEGQTLALEELNRMSLADDWDLFHNNEPVIISQCYAARASIGMAGHGKALPKEFSKGKEPDSDFVYWENGKSLKWDTYSAAYSVPDSVKQYDLYNFYLANKATAGAEFQVRDRLDLQAKLHHFQASEYQVLLDGESIRKAIESEILSKNKHLDEKTDMVYVTLKATDAVGHLFGWESEEARNILKKTDEEVEKIYGFLEKNFGEDFILVITADHGAAPMPEISLSSFLGHETFFQELGTLLPEEKRKNQSVVKWITHSQLSLNRDVMKENGISEEQVIEKIKRLTVNDKPFFRKVWTRKEVTD
ncbi:alkaline phosphatase family protein [Leptospira idonii]|uniref:Type I phosphodiesterase/nucleotide pyrophosphatase n=1 Tax=Leptospira idonii TaxID=1193500 RepID=A0A4R9M6N8_9LEPT|nr:alkaline phosphatase family protein [Leptospira idonii]TGN20338.1 type I phosphodiesterase/nucleotide pyrophosphatase [Leptospira idonii]